MRNWSLRNSLRSQEKRSSRSRNYQDKITWRTLEIKIENGNKIRMRGPAEYILEDEISDLSKIYSNL